jgi:hypothetical protein
MGASARPYVSGNFAFQLDGLDCGMIQKLEGGNIQAEVVNLANSAGYLQKKHLGPIKVNDFKMQMAGIQGGPLYQWIKSALDMNHLYKNGAILAKNFNQETESIREFTDALLTEIGLPAGDGAAKDPAYLSISFAAQHVRTKPGDKAKDAGALNVNQKRLLGSNFRLTVDRVKDACKRIAKFDALTVKMGVQRDDIGDAREMELVPGKIDVPNLSFQLAEVDSKAIYDWHEDFVIKGNCGEESETTAELSYYSQDFSKELVRVTMKNIGIFNVTSDASEDHKDAIKRCKVECYMESLEIDFPGA